jgi:hypothetical protein
MGMQNRDKYDLHTRNLTPAFTTGITAESPADSRCLCTWVWAPRIGKPAKPWVLKYLSVNCPVRHSRLRQDEPEIDPERKLKAFLGV